LYYPLSAFTISRAAFAPEPPVNPAPGWVPLPDKYRFWIGVRYRAQAAMPINEIGDGGDFAFAVGAADQEDCAILHGVGVEQPRC